MSELEQIRARYAHFAKELDRRRDELTAPYRNEDLASMQSMHNDIRVLLEFVSRSP